MAALPYTEILTSGSKRDYAEDSDRVAGFEIHLGTKKTTHALHRRFAVISGVSTSDVIRLPNWAGICIRDVFGMR